MAEIDISTKLGGTFPKLERVEKPMVADPQAGGSQKGASFIDNLKEALGNVNESIQQADKATQNFATGKAQNLHDVMIAMEKADLSLRTLTAVRGKVMDAYHEIMKMPI